MKKILLLGACCAVVVSLSGCASMFSRSNYNVSITTNSPAASITVRNTSGVILSSGEAPMIVGLKSNDGPFSAASYMCEVKDNATNKKQTRVINAQFCPWVFGNFIFGGVIGIAIDGFSGAMYRLEDSVYVHFSEYDK